MSNSGNVFANLARRANDAFLAPFVVVPNVGLAMINGAVGGSARLGEVTAQAAATAGVPLAGFAESLSKRVADSTLGTASESVRLAADAASKAAGGGPPQSTNTLLGTTMVDPFLDTFGLPFTVTFDSVAAAFDVEPFKQTAWEAWVLFVRALQPLSIKGVLPGRIGAETNADVLFGYYYGSTEGPLQAVVRDVRGVLGGFLALGFGDFETLGKALPDYWRSLEYVYDKKVNDEVQPEVNFPIAARTASLATNLITRFPYHFTQALQSGDPLQVLRQSIHDFGLVLNLLGRFPFFEVNVPYDVAVYVARAMFETGDAQSFVLCELAIMESTLADEEKDSFLDTLYHKTATNNAIQYEFYQPLLVPLDGTPADQAYRSDAAGRRIPDHAKAQSVFEARALHRAQVLNSQVYSLRSFLWLYRDEEAARQKNRQETLRKFGPEVTARIEQQTLYPPLTAEQVTELTRGDPRPQREINGIFLDLLRKRGLISISNRVATHLPGGLPYPTVPIPETPPSITRRDT